MDKRDTNNRIVAELIARLGWIASRDGLVSGLTATQLTAQRFLAHAKRFSRTVSAFAEFHETTRANASQTIKGLICEGYLTRTRSEADGRSIRLNMTGQGLGHSRQRSV